MSKPKELFTIVAFRYDQKRSVYYSNFVSPETIAKKVEKCLSALGADVISIRRVYEERPTLQKKIL